MNLEKSPRTIPIKKNKEPGPTTYQVEKMKLGTILSTVVNNKPHRIVYDKSKKSPDGDLDRFIDIHKKQKKWVPPVTRYNYTADQLRKYTSVSPNIPRSKRWKIKIWIEINYKIKIKLIFCR